MDLDHEVADVIVIDGVLYRKRWRATRQMVGQTWTVPGRFDTETEALEAAVKAGGKAEYVTSWTWCP